MMAASASTSRVKTNENIQVYLRVRPMNDRERHMRSHEAVDVTSNREVVVKQDNRSTKKFTFDRSFGQDSNQVTVYQSVVAPFIEEVLAGYNCTVFAYGQTGTGKTHTMIGEESPNVANSWDDISQVGIIPRAVSHLFEELRIMGVDFSMRISFLELYNEELTDLLSSTDQTPIRIYDDNSKKGSIIVHGLEELPVHNSSDVYKLLAKGQEKRKTASTLMNVQSSRSHTIFSILVHIREYNVDGEEVLKVGKLNLVDLAGSENISKAGNEKGIRTRETVNINQSLLTLGRVITALVERTPHIPYRESKLTRLLQESLGGRTKTSIIATVSPGHRDLEETLSTLEYAHRAKNIQNKPEINQKLTKKLALKEYTEEIDRLKRDLMASRSKNGIYLAEETYAEMNCRLDAQNKELSEKQTTIKVLKDEVAKIQKIFNEVSLNLVKKETELAVTYETLHSTKAELGHTVQVLRNTNKRYHEKRELLANHVQTEQLLTSQAQQLRSAADLASTDTHLLHDTLERRKLTDHNIVSVSDNFEKSMQSNINDIAADFDNFNYEIDNQSKSFVEHVDCSIARNNEFSAKVLHKLTEQRLSTDVKADQVKKLLQEAITGEMMFTSEQMELVSSVIKQCIQDDRKFNEGLSNDMLKTHLSLIESQNSKLLESHSMILEMISAQRESFSNFTTAQLSKLQTLSVDAANLLANCRSTAETGVTKSNEIVESISKLLDELRSNNENMNTIAPGISASIDTVTKATKDQIDETSKIKEAVDKRSDEQTKKLIEFSDDIKQQSESNRNGISKIIASVNNHTKLFSATLKSSKIKICEQLEKQKKVVVAAFANIENKVVEGVQNVQSSSMDITNDIECVDKILKEDADKNLSFKNSFSGVVRQFSKVSKKKLDCWRKGVMEFRQNDLKVYSPSGATPAKREFNYPKVLAATSPHDRIVRRFWSAHNESDLDVSMSISEGNETAFMNGVNEVQSSSMVQRPTTSFIGDINDVLSSSMVQQPVATIVEDMEDLENLEGINEGDLATESPSMIPLPIFNRVLSEIPVSVTNTPISRNVTIKPFENPLRESGISNDQIPPQDTDAASSVDLSHSNKENL